MNGKYKVLFVCLGNICRSPSAEAVFREAVDKAGMSGKVEVDSAGIIGYHAGEGADPRMKRHGVSTGYRLTSISPSGDCGRFQPFRFDRRYGRSEHPGPAPQGSRRMAGRDPENDRFLHPVSTKRRFRIPITAGRAGVRAGARSVGRRL